VKELLTAESLGNLSEGYVGKMLQRALSDVTKDIYDRGHDRQKRKIVLTLDFVTKDDKIYISPSVQTKMPAFVPPMTIAKFNNAANGIEFSPVVADNPEQGTFNDIDEETEKPRKER